MKEELIAPCGMNCGICVSYLAMKNDINRQGFKRSYCPGCRPRGKNCTHMKERCEKLGQGLIRFCYHCEEYPCRRLKNLDKRYRTKYQMSMIENLEFIRKHGMEQFLESEETRWGCPRCGEAICCHVGLCIKCDLEKWRQNRKYRWGT